MKVTGRMYKKSILLFMLAALIGGMQVDATAQSAQSDYEIQQNFNNKYNALADSLEAARTTDEINRLAEEIKELEENYREHQELLNNVLYPSSFEKELTRLKRRTVSTQQRLATIERQEEKLGELNEQLSSYDKRMNILSSRTDSLLTAMEQKTRSENELSGLVRQYRENLEKRDGLILSFIDSVMVTYDRLGLDSVQDLESTSSRSQLTTDGNALKMIEGIARQNVDFLESNPRISTEEYLRMNAVQQEFEEMWNTLGDNLAEIYAEGDSDEAKERVDLVVKEWNQKVTDKTWSSLNKAVEQEGIDIPEFSNRKEFNDSINGYLDNAISASKEKATEEGFNNYQRFRSFWTNQVKVKWADYLNQGDILTNRQMASIDQKIDEWAINAEPEQSNLLVYLLGASVLAIVVLGVMLAREKTNKHS